MSSIYYMKPYKSRLQRFNNMQILDIGIRETYILIEINWLSFHIYTLQITSFHLFKMIDGKSCSCYLSNTFKYIIFTWTYNNNEPNNIEPNNNEPKNIHSRYLNIIFTWSYNNKPNKPHLDLSESKNKSLKNRFMLQIRQLAV